MVIIVDREIVRMMLPMILGVVGNNQCSVCSRVINPDNFGGVYNKKLFCKDQLCVFQLAMVTDDPINIQGEPMQLGGPTI
jgi:hypothetical protein